MQTSTFLTLALSAMTIVTAAPTPSPQYSSISGLSELGWCIIPWHISACSAAKGHAETASTTAENLFPEDSLHNGQGDAFRHCYWNARMAIDIGADDAKSIADNHEDASDGPADERSMDLANNETGRGVGTSTGDYTAAQNECERLARNGGLIVLK